MSEHEFTYGPVGRAYTFRLGYLPALTSAKLSARVGRILAATIEGQDAKQLSLGSVDLGRAVMGVLRQLSEADLDVLVGAFRAVTSVRLPAPAAFAGTPVADAQSPFGPLDVVFENVFGAGAQGRLWAWLLFAVKHEYSDFFSEAQNGSIANALGFATELPST